MQRKCNLYRVIYKGASEYPLESRGGGVVGESAQLVSVKSR